MHAFRLFCVGLLFIANAVVGLDLNVGTELQSSAGGRLLSRSLLGAAATTKKSPGKKSPGKKSPGKKVSKSPPGKSPGKKSPKTSPKPPAPKSSSPKPTPSAGGSQTVHVGPDGLSVFKPEKLTITAGTEIVFILESLGHNVVFTEVPAGVDKNKLSAPQMVMEGEIGYKHTVKLTVSGEYKYMCTPHAGIGMLGTVTVS